MIKVDGHVIECTSFPNGETCFPSEKILKVVKDYERRYPDRWIGIEYKYEGDASLLQLLMVARYVKDSCHLKLKLHVRYMPYSRMDRSEGGSLFSLKYVADMLNSLEFDEVYIDEPHSGVTTALINNSYGMKVSEMLLEYVLEQEGLDKEDTYVLFPDAGAQKRYGAMGMKELVGYKKRNFKTGEILSYEVFGEEDLGGKPVIIMDDLCSKGTTFFHASNKLKEMGAGDIFLVVAHCENTILEGVLPTHDPITRIYTSQSIIDHYHGVDKVVRVRMQGVVIDDVKLFPYYALNADRTPKIY